MLYFPEALLTALISIQNPARPYWAPGLPPGPEAVVSDLERTCRASGGRSEFGGDFLFGGDVTGDGVEDILLNSQFYYCFWPGESDPEQAALRHPNCTERGCSMWFFASGPRRRYRLAWRGTGFSAFLDGAVISYLTQRNCETRGCSVALVWNGRTLVPAP